MFHIITFPNLNGAFWLWGVGISEKNAADGVGESAGSGSPYGVFKKVTKCKSPGWYSIIRLTNMQNEYVGTQHAGACGKESRLAAEAAAVASCRGKNSCWAKIHQYRIELMSGFDSGTYDRMAIIKKYQRGFAKEHAGEQFIVCTSIVGRLNECAELASKKKWPVTREELISRTVAP